MVEVMLQLVSGVPAWATKLKEQLTTATQLIESVLKRLENFMRK